MVDCKIKLQREKSSSWHDLTVHDAFGFMKEGRVCFRIRATKLSDSVLEPLVVGRSNFIHEFLFNPPP